MLETKNNESVWLNGFTVLITGGSSGLGYEMAQMLLKHGAKVIIAARNQERLDKAYSTLTDKGYDVHKVLLDVRDEESIKSAASWFTENFDHLDMLINNAGISMSPEETPARFYDIPTSTFRNIVETDFTGYFLVSKVFVPLMIQHGKGRIVNVSTSIPTMTRKGMIPYGPARAGMEAMSKILSEELRDLNIMVNVICPGGPTDTPMASAELRINLEKNHERLLPVSILNRPILFLASKKSDNLTGERIVGKEFDEWLELKLRETN